MRLALKLERAEKQHYEGWLPLKAQPALWVAHICMARI